MFVIAKTDIPSWNGKINHFSKGMAYSVEKSDTPDSKKVLDNQSNPCTMSKKYYHNNFIEAKENLIVLHKGLEGIIINVNTKGVKIYFPDTEEMKYFSNNDLLELRNKC